MAHDVASFLVSPGNQCADADALIMKSDYVQLSEVSQWSVNTKKVMLRRLLYVLYDGGLHIHTIYT